MSLALFLAKLGLRQFIPQEELLALCASKRLALRFIALNYFTTNFQAFYANTYKAKNIQTPFLPCVGTEELSLPGDCYTEPGCAVLGFRVLDENWRKFADSLGIRSCPLSSELVQQLALNTPNLTNASEMFSFLSTRIGGELPLYFIIYFN